MIDDLMDIVVKFTYIRISKLPSVNKVFFFKQRETRSVLHFKRTILAAALRLACKGARIETRRAVRNGAGFLRFQHY